MYLLPHFRGQGIGTLLLNSAENRLRELEYEDGVLFAVEDMPSSVRFYEKNGWRKTGAERTDLGGLDPFLVRMEKTLG
jgi:GNAT superfamily N-acetyltransferase